MIRNGNKNVIIEHLDQFLLEIARSVIEDIVVKMRRFSNLILNERFGRLLSRI